MQFVNSLRGVKLILFCNNRTGTNAARTAPFSGWVWVDALVLFGAASVRLTPTPGVERQSASTVFEP